MRVSSHTRPSATVLFPSRCTSGGPDLPTLSCRQQGASALQAARHGPLAGRPQPCRGAQPGPPRRDRSSHSSTTPGMLDRAFQPAWHCTAAGSCTLQLRHQLWKTNPAVCAGAQFADETPSRPSVRARHANPTAGPSMAPSIAMHHAAPCGGAGCAWLAETLHRPRAVLQPSRDYPPTRLCARHPSEHTRRVV